MRAIQQGNGNAEDGAMGFGTWCVRLTMHLSVSIFCLLASTGGRWQGTAGQEARNFDKMAQLGLQFYHGPDSIRMDSYRRASAGVDDDGACGESDESSPERRVLRIPGLVAPARPESPEMDRQDPRFWPGFALPGADSP
jgi:hypothetical protein